MSLPFFTKRRRGPVPHAGTSRPPQRLRLEALEHRCLLTTYTITDLGVIPGGIYSVATSINNEDQIVGYSALQGSSYHNAFLYNNGHLTNLGLPPGYAGGGAYSISDTGNIVGDIYKVDPNKHHAAIYNPDGSITDVPPLGSNSSHFFGVDNAGDAVGYSETPDSIPTHAVLYTGGNLMDLGTLPGDMFSWAYAINDAGQIVGKSGGGQVNHAFIYQDGIMTDLGTLGGPSAIADAITNNGLIVGYSTPDNASDVHAFLLDENGMTDLGTLPDFTASYAYGLNSSGVVVGTCKNSDSTSAFVYEDGQMFNLNDLVVNGQKWTLLNANAINDAGVIVGNGDLVIDDFGTTRNHAFMLTPISDQTVVLNFGQSSAQMLGALSGSPEGSGFTASPWAVQEGHSLSSQQVGDVLGGPTSQSQASLVSRAVSGSTPVHESYFVMLGSTSPSSDLFASPLGSALSF
jgi:probable HAF family extracellular repeat protein